MKAIRVENQRLVWTDVAEPVCGPQEVIVKVQATAVNRADILQRKGFYPPPVGASEILGLEAAGVIAQVGRDVSGWRVGDKVCCLLAGGGYAEYVATPASLLIRVPPELPLEVAASIPEVFYTAFLNVFLEATLQENERLLVHAGASGVGTAAIQLAVNYGAEVFATASATKLEFLAGLGAHAIDRHAEDFAAHIMDLTDGEGVDVILDPVGGMYLDQNIRCMARQGRLVLIALMGGGSANIDLKRLLGRQLTVMGSTLRNRSVEEKAELTDYFLREVWPLILRGEISPVIDSVFRIEDADRAHAHLESNQTIGKVVLTVGRTVEDTFPKDHEV